MRKENIASFTDLLSYADKIGYSWNQAHKILVDDEVPPMYETKVRYYSLDELEEYSFSEDSLKILKGFMEENKVEEFTLVG